MESRYRFMASQNIDKRSISGQRLYARCEFELPHVNLFSSTSRVVKAGNLVFNTRGGCLYVSDAVDDAMIEQVFSRKRTTTFKSIMLFPTDASPVLIRDVGARFLRARREMTRDGMIFRFSSLSDKAFEALDALSAVLPQFDPSMDFPELQGDNWNEVGLVPSELATGTDSYWR